MPNAALPHAPADDHPQRGRARVVALVAAATLALASSAFAVLNHLKADRGLEQDSRELVETLGQAIAAQRAVADLHRIAGTFAGTGAAPAPAAQAGELAAARSNYLRAFEALHRQARGEPERERAAAIEHHLARLQQAGGGAAEVALPEVLLALDRDTTALVDALIAAQRLQVQDARASDTAAGIGLLGASILTLAIGLAVAGQAWRMADRSRRLVGRLRELVHLDGLTGVVNRRGLDERLPLETARAQREATPLTVVMLDLDHFKRYNDRKGHAAGDALLRAAAAAWRRQLRPTDLLARYGGEEFTLLLPRCDTAQAVALVERLRPELPDQQTFSAGVAQWDLHERAEDLLARADRALLLAKRSGRNRTVVAEPDRQMTLPLQSAGPTAPVAS